MTQSTLIHQLSPSIRNGQLAHAILINTLDHNQTWSQLVDLVSLMLCNSADLVLGKACGLCKQCQLLNAGHHPDLSTIQTPNSSIGVDEIRMVSEKLTKTPQIAQSQIVVIDNAEKMTENAANALLKTLEEPTSNSFLILVNVGHVKLLPTIVSRCQQLNQPLLSKQELKEKYNHLPDYIIGFADQNESLLQRISNSEVMATYTSIYQCFVSWLKGQPLPADVITLLQGSDEHIDFFVYLLTRRIRQMLIKGYLTQAQEAQSVLTDYSFARRNVKGHNKALAMTASIQQLEGLIR